jgi:FkbM family methyltransferase
MPTRTLFHRIFLRDEYRLDALSGERLGTVLDLGANVGLFSVRVSQLAERVIAYEPFPENYAQLELNVRERPNVETVRVAVSDKSGWLQLYTPQNAGQSGIYSAYGDKGAALSGDSVRVPSVRLDELFEKHEIRSCDLLKIDVEGAEYAILYAASEATLARIRSISGEYHDVRADDPSTRIDRFSKHLREAGFCVEIAPHRKKPNHGTFTATRTDAERPEAT